MSSLTETGISIINNLTETGILVVNNLTETGIEIPLLIKTITKTFTETGILVVSNLTETGILVVNNLTETGIEITSMSRTFVKIFTEFTEVNDVIKKKASLLYRDSIISDIISVSDTMRVRLQHIPEYIADIMRIYLKPKKLIAWIKAIFS